MRRGLDCGRNGGGRAAAFLAMTLAVSTGGCVMDCLVEQQEVDLRLARQEVGRLDARLDGLRREIQALEAKAGPEATAQRRRDLERDLAQQGLRVTSRGPEIVVTLADTVLFNAGEAKVRAQARGTLLKLAEILRTRFPDQAIRIEGHTDSAPPRRVADQYPTNWELSAARALAVLQFLVDEGNIPETRVFAAAHGQYQPVSDNSSREGREANRRVDIVIMPSLDVERVERAEDTELGS